MEYIKSKSLYNKKKYIYTKIVDKISYIILFANIEAVFLKPSLDIILGPVIAYLLWYLYNKKKNMVLVTTIIIVANDALGTIFLGRVAFQYLLLLFCLIDLYQRKKVLKRSLWLSISLLVICIQLYITNNISMDYILKTFIFTESLILVVDGCEINHKQFIEEFIKSYIIIIELISLHTYITGGIIYYELNKYSMEFLRKGILGVGVGDSNFSALSLCVGIVCVLNSKLNIFVKVLCLIPILIATSVTLSTTGIITIILIFLLYFFIGRKLYRSAIPILGSIISFIFSIQIYLLIPEKYHIEVIDRYIDRIISKIELFEKGDLIEATTNRALLTKNYLHYIGNEQSILGWLFGGNSLFILGGVSHNTGIDLILRFGFLGFCIIVFYIMIRIFKCVRKRSVNNLERRTVLMLKMVYLIYSLTLSIYGHSTFALLYLCLIIL